MQRALAWASPLPPQRSGISDYSAELLPALKPLCSLRVLLPRGLETEDLDLGGVDVVARDVDPLEEETLIANLGNSALHGWIFEEMSKRPSIAVVHDLVLHHGLLELSARGEADYSAEGTEVLAAARARGFSDSLDPFLVPLRSLVRGRLLKGALVHSEWARELLERELELPVERIPLAMADAPEHDERALREELGVPENTLLIMHLGFLTPEKGLERLLHGLAAAVELGVDLRLVLVGSQPDRDLLERASALGLESKVQGTGWVPIERLRALPRVADLGLVYREPSAGETSAAVLRFLAAGTPVAVSAQAQMLEWPPRAVFRLTPGASAAAELARLLLAVDGDRQRLKSAGEIGWHYWNDHHRPELVASNLLQALERLECR